MIHPTAIVDSKAEIDSDVEIGPYSIINGSVQIGKGCVIGPHVTVEPYVSISQNCHIYQYASIGAKPQDLKFKGEKSYLKIGRGTVIREINRKRIKNIDDFNKIVKDASGKVLLRTDRGYVIIDQS